MKMKKIVSLLTAFACTGVLMGLVSLVASAYDVCDVDHDGKVNILDVITINRYLAGYTSSKGYNQLDANQNLIVDANDATCVMSKAVGNAYSAKFYSRKQNKTFNFPTVSSAVTLDAYADSKASRTYKRYSYATDKELNAYSLIPSTEPINAQSGISAYSNVGEDTRYPANGLPENTGIVRINKATGFIVGDHVIATAGHCVYGENKVTQKGEFAPKSKMSITTYDSAGNLTTKTLTPVEAHIPMAYSTSYDTVYDYALITVAEDLSDYYHFNLGNSYNTTTGNYRNIPVYVTGCPGNIDIPAGAEKEEDGTPNTDNLLYTDEGRVYGKANTSLLYYTTDTSSGDSGAPVYIITRTTAGGETTESATVLAVHSGGNHTRNVGSLITKYQLQFYKNNPYISY